MGIKWSPKADKKHKSKGMCVHVAREPPLWSFREGMLSPCKLDTGTRSMMSSKFQLRHEEKHRLENIFHFQLVNV